VPLLRWKLEEGMGTDGRWMVGMRGDKVNGIGGRHWKTEMLAEGVSEFPELGSAGGYR